MKTKSEMLIQILTEKYYFIYAIVALVTLAIIPMPYKLIGAWIIYTLFDLIGYESIPAEVRNMVTNTLTGPNTDANKLYREHHLLCLRQVQGYRILQHTFSFLFALCLFLLFGWKFLVCYLIGYWFGMSDIFYHAIGKYTFITEYWMQWTPIGLILGRKIKLHEVIIQASVGVGLIVLILKLF